MWKENDLRPALASLAANRLRTALTIAIIAIGITSLVGIETAIDILSKGLSGSFSKMGNGTVSICSSTLEGHRPLTKNDLSSFLARWKGVPLSLQAELSVMEKVSSGERHTDPVVRILASDEARIEAAHLELMEGRNFTTREQWKTAEVCIAGWAVASKLFGQSSPIGKTIKVGGIPFTVCGVLKRQGSLFGSGYDNTVIIPYGNINGRMPLGESTLSIDLIAGSDALGNVAEEAVQTMRAVRRLSPAADNDFCISTGEGLAHKLDSIKTKLSVAAFVIGLITLLGATVGLMNILLVSVKERKSEIGLRKALGARKKSIRRMFITEALIIGQIGGIAGIAAGVVAGNAVAIVMDGGFSIPWIWIARACLICIAVSLLAATIPSSRAAQLNPVDALKGH